MLEVIQKTQRTKKQAEAIRAEQKQKQVKSDRNSLTKFKDDPVGFSRFIGVEPTPDQQRFLESVRDNPETNVKAAHGVGKSIGSAVCVLWWVFAVEGLAITTAPTEDQVKQILWSETRKIYDRNKEKLGGTRGELFLRKSETARAYGFTARNYDTNSFQGKHAERLLLIADEADGISEIIDDGFQSCLTGSSNRGLRIGNPLNKQSPFSKACDRTAITIPAWNHPNVSWAYQVEETIDPSGKARLIHRLKPFVALQLLDSTGRIKPQDSWPPEFPRDVIPGAISLKWIEEVRQDKGEFSVFWQGRVEGEFPEDVIEGIIPQSWLKAARERYDNNPEYWDKIALLSPWRIGVDVADGGDDSHAVSLWRGNVLYSVVLHECQGDEQDTIRLADIVKKQVDKLGGNCYIAVDRTGVGAGTLGRLKQQGYHARGCVYGESAENPEEFNNRKTELFWKLRDDLRLGKIAIAPIEDIEDRVFEDLFAHRYSFTGKGGEDKQIACESKKSVKKRLKRSPDAGDSVIIGSSCPNPHFTEGVPEQEHLKKQYQNSWEQTLGDDVSVQKVRDLFS